MIDVIGQLIILGLLDSLNPFSIAALALVLTGTRHKILGSVFIAVTYVIYFVAGIAMLAGWAAFLLALLPLIPPLVVQMAFGILGLVCICAAFLMWRKNQSASPPLADLVRTSILGTALYAASSTISDLPTALPYFAAIPIIAGTELSWLSQITLLLFYSLLYVTPLVVLLLLRLNGKSNTQKSFDKVKAWVDWSFAHLIPPTTVCFGLYCFWVALK